MGMNVIIFISLFLSTTMCAITTGFAQTDWQKYPGNPVMIPGPPGAWDDHWMFNGGVLFDDSTYHMWYSSWDGVNTRIGYATSPDGKAWTKYAGNPVLDIGLPGSWDESVTGATVVYHESVYHMWYSGTDTSGVTRLGYATSPDRIIWTKYANNPVMDVGSPGTWDAGILWGDVIFTDSLYQLWYTGWDSTNLRIGYSTSPDGITWTKYAGNPVLDKGLPGSWEAGGATSPSIIYDDGTYHLWYAGGEELSPGTPFFTLNPLPGYATSTDGINWTKYAGNPLSDDASDVGSGDVYYDGSTYHMWFSFCEWDGECQYRIHYSTSGGITGIDEKSYNFPNQFELSQNYPNPFNPTTTIRYTLTSSQFVTLKVYNVLGQEIRTLINSYQTSGYKSVVWDGKNNFGQITSSGIYIYRLKAGNKIRSKKTLFLR